MADESKLYMQMRAYLLELIERNQDVPGYRLPSETQLAIKFGASRIAAKHAYKVLCEEGRILRQQGRGSFIAPKAQWHADGMPEKKSNGNPSRGLSALENSVALIVPFTSTIFMSEIMNGIFETLKAHNMQCITFITDSDQKREGEYLHLAQETFKGILLFPSDFSTYHPEVLRLVLNRFPLVQIDRSMPQLNLSDVACDHYDATYRAVEFLHEKGHERIGFIGHRITHASSVAERVRGYEDAMMKINPNCVPLKLNVDNSLEGFEEIFLKYLLQRKPTAIISSSHLHAPTIMRVLKRTGRVNDVDLMLYDNEYVIAEEFMSCRPYIIDQQPRLIGQTAADLIYRLIYECIPPQSIRLKARFFRLGDEN